MFTSQVPDYIQVPFKIMEIIYNSDVICILYVHVLQ